MNGKILKASRGNYYVQGPSVKSPTQIIYELFKLYVPFQRLPTGFHLENPKTSTKKQMTDNFYQMDRRHNLNITKQANGFISGIYNNVCP